MGGIMVTPLDLLNPYEYNENSEEVKERMKTCKSCDFFYAGVCKKCGCIMKFKTKLRDATCPLGKW
jgi:hypothetical protein